MEQRTVTIKNIFRIADPDIQHRRMTYPPEREFNANINGRKTLFIYTLFFGRFFASW